MSGPSSIQHIDARGPVADRIVLEFAQAHMFSPGEVTLRGDRVCRVNPQLARNVVGLAFRETLGSARSATESSRVIQSTLSKVFGAASELGRSILAASAEQLPATNRSGL